MTRVGTVVVGGGISGLAAAWRLLEIGRAGGDPPSFVVLERDPRPGGQIRTERRGDFLLECGPDALLAQKPAAVELCARLGLAGDVEDVAPRRGGIHVVHRGRLVPVPEGFAVVAPSRLGPALASPLFSWRGKLRLLLEPLVPKAPAQRDDESLASFVTRRFGREVLDRVAEPVAASLFMADAERMSLRMTMPRFLDIERGQGSLSRALRRAARAPARAPFATVRGGLGRIVEAIASALPSGVLRTGAAVESLAPPGASGSWTVRLADGRTIEADAVLLACPAYDAARVLREADPELSERLDRLSYASCATVHLGWREEGLGARLEGSGFFVPRGEGLPILACTFVSRKFPGRSPDGIVVVRAFLGGALSPRILDLDDAGLVAAARGALEPLLGVRAEPVLTAVHRHPSAMPLYDVGARAWVDAVLDRAGTLPGLAFAGSVAGAVGIPDCVRSGERAAERLLARAATARTGADVGA